MRKRWPRARGPMPRRTSSRAATRGMAAAPAPRPGRSRPSGGRARAFPCRAGPHPRAGRRQRRSRRGVLRVDLPQAAAHAALAGHELALEPLEPLLAPAHELELVVDELHRLVKQPAAVADGLGLGEFSPNLGARLLGGHQLAELVQAEIEQVAQPHHFLEALHVVLRIETALALLAILHR